MKWTIMAAVVATLTMSAAAQIPLWQNVNVGMSYAEVQALYPASDAVVHKTNSIGLKHFQITSGCEGRVNIRFEKGLVASVDIYAPLGYKAWKNDADCGRTILNAMTRKYGDPNRSRESVTEGKWIDVKEKKYVWLTEGGSDIRLELSNTDPVFVITYSAPSLDAAL